MKPEPIATFKRISDCTHHAYSDVLECEIIFDTGSTANIISSELLYSIRKSDYTTQPNPINKNVRLSDGSTTFVDWNWEITLPFSRSLWYKGLYYERESRNKDDKYLVLGLDFLKRYVILYTRDTIQILEEYPDDFNIKVPLYKRDNLYYVNLKVNGHEKLFFLDTGHANPITRPMSDLIHAISPVHEEEDEVIINGIAKSEKEMVEERGRIQIGEVVRHGPISYTDFFKRFPYWFNPAMIFAEFVLDLRGGVIGYRF